MIERIETERLSLRRITPPDRTLFVCLYGDPEVMEIRKLGVLDTRRAERQFEVMLAHWRTSGFGYWVVEDKATRRFLGECGLLWTDDGQEVKLSYGYMPEVWGRGVAFEAASAVLKVGFDDIGLDTIVAYSRGDNLASHRVLEKCGMRRVWFRDRGAHGLVKYTMDAADPR